VVTAAVSSRLGAFGKVFLVPELWLIVAIFFLLKNNEAVSFINFKLSVLIYSKKFLVCSIIRSAASSYK
jgi:hypothetical protein